MGSYEAYALNSWIGKNFPELPTVLPRIEKSTIGLQERCVPATRRINSGQTLLFLAHLKRSHLSGYEKTLSLLRVLALQMPFAHLGS